MKSLLQAMLTMAVAGALAIGAAQTPAAPKDAAKPAATTAKAKAAPPTAAEIADAKSKGLVWVNLNTKVFHKDGEFYGKTKSGKFMTDADAVKAGYRAAKEPVKKAPKTAAKDKKS